MDSQGYLAGLGDDESKTLKSGAMRQTVDAHGGAD
jgi:hypothetical protein